MNEIFAGFYNAKKMLFHEDIFQLVQGKFQIANFLAMSMI